jgi:hypothetical protein
VYAVVNLPGWWQACRSGKDVSKLVEQSLKNIVGRGAVKVHCSGRCNTLPLDGMIKLPERHGLSSEIPQY